MASASDFGNTRPPLRLWVFSKHTEIKEVPVTRVDWLEFAGYFAALFLVPWRLRLMSPQKAIAAAATSHART